MPRQSLDRAKIIADHAYRSELIAYGVIRLLSPHSLVYKPLIPADITKTAIFNCAVLTLHGYKPKFVK